MKNLVKQPSDSTIIRVDFHCHTSFSPDSLLSPERLIATCKRKGIDKITITDHNTIQGAIIAKDMAPDLIIVGEEIMTTKGELLAFFVQEEIPKDLSPKQAIQRLKEQDAFISVSHPFDKFRGGHWHIQDLLEIAHLVDAIETFNARCFLPSANRQAIKFQKRHKLLGTHGSDAHKLEMGVCTSPPFTTEKL